MNKVSEFYKELLESLNIHVDNNGLISIEGHGIKKPLDIDGIPLYLPTDENINTTIEVVDGKPTPTKVLFNPLEEDVYKGVNESYTKLKNIMELKLLGVVGNLGISLLSIMAENSGELTDMELIKFVNVLNKNKVGKRKSMVDEKTISTWINLYEKVLSKPDHRYVKFFNKKGGKIDGIHYNRVGTIVFPFIEKFRKAIENKQQFLDTKLRVVDQNTINSLFEYMFQTLEPKGINQFGSLNKKSPSLHLLLLEYDSVYKRLSPIIETIVEHGVEDDVIEQLMLKPLPVRAETLGDYIDSLEAEVRRVPNEAAVVNATPAKKPSILMETQPTQKKSGSFWDKVSSNQPNQQVQQPPVYQQPAPVQQPPVYQTPPPPVRQPAYQAPAPVQQQPVYPQQVQQPVSNPFGTGRRPIVADDPWSQPQQPAYGNRGPVYPPARSGW